MKRTLEAVLFGTGAWAIALVIELVRKAPSSSIWICLVGVAFGAIGLLDLKRRSKN